MIIDVIAQNGERLGRMTFAEAQQIALVNRLSLVELNSSSMFKLVDLGKRKYLEKKRRSKNRLANRVIRKHVEIKSNIDARDLNIKFGAISRFLNNKYRISVMLRHLKLVTTRGVYDRFVEAVKARITELTNAFEGPIATETGDSAFYLFGDGSQDKSLQIKNQVCSKEKV
ncbi:MAG: hypothetical protein AAI946_00185 [Candidatus Hodgkinia cicadicola]